MAITVLNALTGAAAAAPAAGNQFATTGPFTLYADSFVGEAEGATLYRLGPSGGYFPATNKDGVIKVKDYPNMSLVETAGTFRVGKTATASASACVGYEEF